MRPNISILQEGKEVNEVDFGIIPIGTSKTLDIEVKNKGNATLFDIEYSVPHLDVVILNSPSALKPNDSGTITFKYTPSEEREEGLKSKLFIKGVFVV